MCVTERCHRTMTPSSPGTHIKFFKFASLLIITQSNWAEESLLWETKHFNDCFKGVILQRFILLLSFLFLLFMLLGENIWGVCSNPPSFESKKTRQALHTCMQAKFNMFLERYTILRALYVVFCTFGFLLEGKANLMSDGCLGWLPTFL